MKTGRLFAASAVLLAACAVRQPYTATSILAERKAYVRCAVDIAFSVIDTQRPALDVAQAAVRECDAHRNAVYDKLKAENAGRFDALSYVTFYLNELDATMVSQIAARLTQARIKKRASEEAQQREQI